MFIVLNHFIFELFRVLFDQLKIKKLVIQLHLNSIDTIKKIEMIPNYNNIQLITIPNGLSIYQKYGIGKSLHLQKGIDKDNDTIVINSIEWKYLKEMNELQNETIERELTEKEMIQYQVYCELRKKNYYIKDGLKYGCDFVVYKQHPEECHSYCGVIILQLHQELLMKDIVGLCRLLHNVKKQLVICTLNDNDICFKEFQWEQLDNK